MNARFKRNDHWQFPMEGSTVKSMACAQAHPLPAEVQPRVKSESFAASFAGARALLVSQPTVRLLGALRHYPDTEEAAFIPW